MPGGSGVGGIIGVQLMLDGNIDEQAGEGQS
jgi:hypothetical protein